VERGAPPCERKRHTVSSSSAFVATRPGSDMSVVSSWYSLADRSSLIPTATSRESMLTARSPWRITSRSPRPRHAGEAPIRASGLPPEFSDVRTGLKRPRFSGGSVWWFPGFFRARPARPLVALAGWSRAARRAAGVMLA
jgi:hypothetical protein